jgi:hypothetical protein
MPWSAPWHSRPEMGAGKMDDEETLIINGLHIDSRSM